MTDAPKPEPVFGSETLDAGLEKQAAAAERISKAMASARKDAAAIKQSAAGTGSSGTGSYGVGNSGNGNLLGNALGEVKAPAWLNSMSPTLGKAVGFASRSIGGAVNAMPGINPVVDRGASYYQAGISGNMGNRKQLENTTLGALSGGLTSIGSDATVANILLGRGMNYSANPGSTYMQTLKGVKSAAQYLNMPNDQAANAIENLTSGPTSASMLMTYGIFTADPSSGKEKTQGQIFEEMYGRFTAGRPKMNTEQTMEELRRGALGSTIRNSNMSDTQKQLFSQFAIEKSKGRTMDLSDPAKMKAMLDETTAGGNANPLKPTQDINTAETQRMGKYENSYVSGMQDAANALKVINPLFDAFTEKVGRLRAAIDTTNSTPTGNALLNMVGDAWKTFTGGGGGGMGLGMAPSSGSTGNGGGGMGMGMSAASPTATASSSVSVGTGGGSGAGTGGGKTPLRLINPTSSGAITLQYGVVDKLHPNGHHGIDFTASKGTSIRASASGTVKNKGDNGSELGYQTWIDHGDGYSTGYCHLSSRLVSSGTYVTQGQEIAKSGNSGTATSGAHLHFTMTKGGSYVDPNPFLQGGGGAPAADSSSAAKGDAATASTNGASTMSVGDPGASGIVGTSSTGTAGGSSSPVNESGLTTIGSSSYSKVSSKGNVGKGTSSGKSTPGGSGTGGGGMGLGMDVGIQSGGSAGSSSISLDASSGGNSGGKNNVVINLQIAKATDDEARKFASVVKGYLEDSSLMANMGSR